jgi:hypothetical protein
MIGELRIDSITLPETGRLYRPGWIDFEVTERTIDRTLVSDFIAIKRRFSVAYDRAYGDLFKQLYDLYLTKQDVTFTEFQPDGSSLSWTCRMSFPTEVERGLNRGLYGYVGFSVTLEEV